MKTVFFRSTLSGRLIMIALLVCVSLLYASFDGATLMVWGNLSHQPIRSVPVSQKLVALTIDVDPWSPGIRDILNILENSHTPATLFVSGLWAEHHRDDLAHAHSQGCTIAGHGFSHLTLCGKPSPEILSELEQTQQAILTACDAVPTLIRAPFGEYDQTLLTACRQMGLTPIHYDVEVRGLPDVSAEQTVQNVLDALHPGAIMRFTVSDATEELLSLLLPELDRLGYRIISAEALVAGDIIAASPDSRP